MKPPQSNKFSVVWLLLGAVAPLSLASLRAAPPVQAWVQRYPGAEGTKIGVDPDGDVVVAGNIGSSGPGLVIKYSGNGVALWTNLWRGASWMNIVEDMAIGTNGNVYVTGYGEAMKEPPDCITIAYSSAGTPLWTNFYGGTYTYPWPPLIRSADDRATGLAVDGSGNVYVSGWSSGYWLQKYVTLGYSSGGLPLWTNLSDVSGGAVGTNYPVFIATDGLGKVYIAGTECGGGESCPFGHAVIAYSDTGVPLWTNLCGGSYSCWGIVRAMTADGAGNIFVAGDNFVTTAFSSTGGRMWFNRYQGSGGYPTAVASSRAGNVYVTGYSTGGGTGYDYLTLAYSSAGTPLWTNRYDGPGHTNDYSQALAVGSDGTVYVTGYSWGTNSFYDYLTIAYSGDGAPLWTNRYNGPANGYDQAFAMAVDSSGNIYVTGYSQGDCTTIKYAPAPPILFSAIDLVSGPACRLTITAPTNLVYRLEASTNLSNWLILTNYTNLPATSIQYTDPLAPGFPGRFYRAVWVP